MLLYHGTRFENVHRILSQGLLPRGSQRGSESGNWSNPSSQTYQSKDDAVYLSNAYAPYYSYMSNLLSGDFIKYESVNGALIEIDTDLLNEHNFYPDEDFLAHSKHFSEEIETIEKRTEYFKKYLESYQSLWKDSLQAMGNCCHLGVIPLTAISRITTWSWDEVETLKSWSYNYVDKMKNGVSIFTDQAEGQLLHLLTKCFAKREEYLSDLVSLLKPKLEIIGNFIDENSIAVSIQKEIEQIKIEYDKDILRNT